MNPTSFVRARARGALYRGVRLLAPRAGLHAYEPSDEPFALLDRLTTYVEDGRPIRDKRPTTAHGEIPDLTITVEGLEDVLAGEDFQGSRVLEVGPKYGVHSLWIDRELSPSELVFSDFEADSPRHAEWVGELRAPHRWVYGDLADADELLELDPFDLVFFLGVLYHSTRHLELLSLLNRVTAHGGVMLLESTIDSRPDPSVRLRWHPDNAKAKAVPTLAALRVMLAWTGWRRVTRYLDYRPGSSEALLRCEKTDELATGRQFVEDVRPQRES